MATIRKFCCNDLLGFASVNLDHLIITTETSLYMTWLAKWSDYCNVAVGPGNRIIAYIIGKTVEASEKDHWLGLLVAVNVVSEYRRLGLATRLMRLFEKKLVEKMLLSPRCYEYYTFLHVVCDDTPAFRLFEQCGYKVTRITRDYYLDDEDEKIDSYEMRKELSEEEEEDPFLRYGSTSLRKWWRTTK